MPSAFTSAKTVIHITYLVKLLVINVINQLSALCSGCG